MKKIIATIATAAAIVTACGTANKAVDIKGEWTIVAIQGETVDIEEMPSLAFDGNKYHGYTGVNLINGEFEREGNVITLGDGAMTRKAGPAEDMEVESRFISLTFQPLTVSLDGENLILSDAEGNEVFKLEPKAE